MNGNKLYKENQKLITKQASYYSKKWNVDYIEVEGLALEIFCKSLNTYNSDKASFTTYLHNQLQNLNTRCKAKALAKKSGHYSTIDYIDMIPDTRKQNAAYRLKESILTDLSEKAQVIVEKILDGSLVRCELNQHLFSTSRVSEQLGYSGIEAIHYVSEIETWWNNFI